MSEAVTTAETQIAWEVAETQIDGHPNHNFFWKFVAETDPYTDFLATKFFRSQICWGHGDEFFDETLVIIESSSYGAGHRVVVGCAPRRLIVGWWVPFNQRWGHLSGSMA